MQLRGHGMSLNMFIKHLTDPTFLPAHIRVSSSMSRSTVTSSAVGRLIWFQSDGPGVSRHNVSTPMDAAGVNALIELVGDDAEVSILHYNVAGDGGQDLLAIFVPAGEGNGDRQETRLLVGYRAFLCNQTWRVGLSP